MTKQEKKEKYTTITIEKELLRDLKQLKKKSELVSMSAVIRRLLRIESVYKKGGLK